MELRALGGSQQPTFTPDGMGAGYVKLYIEPGTGKVVALTDAERDQRDPRWAHRRQAV